MFSPKSSFAALCLLCTALLFSCGKKEAAEIAADAGVARGDHLGTETTVETEPQPLPFEAAYSRTDGYIEKVQYPHVTVLTRRSELEKYTADHEGLYNFYETPASDGFYDLVSSYDAAYFRDHALIVVLLEEGSGSVRHEVSAIEMQDGAGVIHINRMLPPAAGTDDLAEWHVLIELPNDSPVLENPDAIRVVLHDVSVDT